MSYERPTETTNLDIYGHEALDWNRAYAPIVAGQLKSSFFLATVRPDGVPHVAPFGGLWIDDGLYIVSGPGTRKSKNLAENPACTVAVGLEGIDIVLEGSAKRVTDAVFLERAAKAYRDQGWPAEVDADGEGFTAPYSAPSAGPPPWYVYRFDFHTAFGVAGAPPDGATRWRFGD
jgi:hypothetical protein